MSINPYGAILGASALNLQKASSRFNTSVAQLVSGITSPDSQSGDVASLSSAIALQNQSVSLRTVAGNIAQNISLTQTADAGAEQIQTALGRLTEIATQANSGALDDDARNGLNEEFKSLLFEINSLASGTQFGGRNLLDGSISGKDALSFGGALSGDASNTNGEQFTIDALTTGNLLGTAPIDVLSQENAANALARIDRGFAKTMATRASIGGFEQDLEYAGAAILSAAFNQDAARSVLQDSDFAAASTDNAQSALLQNINTSLHAQVHRLAPSMLAQLIG